MRLCFNAYYTLVLGLNKEKRVAEYGVKVMVVGAGMLGKVMG